MSISYAENTATLDGQCSVEEAEGLLEWFIEHPQGVLDLSALKHLHTAILQTLLYLRPKIDKKPKEDSLHWIVDLLQDETKFKRIQKS
ncbi:MAG: hypothetical protein AAGB12_09245 [Pseudomonadota bacterium]